MAEDWRYAAAIQPAMAPCSDEAKHSRQRCLKCGKLLVHHASRQEMDGDGKPEQAHIYLCFTHGFFILRDSQGLKAGL